MVAQAPLNDSPARDLRYRIVSRLGMPVGSRYEPAPNDGSFRQRNRDPRPIPTQRSRAPRRSRR
jgi:hypothetical protein